MRRRGRRRWRRVAGLAGGQRRKPGSRSGGRRRRRAPARLATAFATLNEREADILCPPPARRTRNAETTSEKFGVSRERIRQIEARALKTAHAMTEQAEKRGLRGEVVPVQLNYANTA